MLAILLLALLIASMLMILAGWVLDPVEEPSDAGDTCALLPPPYRRACTDWGLTPLDCGGLADRSRSWASRGSE